MNLGLTFTLNPLAQISKHIRSSCGIAAVICLAWCCTIATAADEARARTQPQTRAQPNIIVLLADDLGYGETGAQGNAEIPTPNIDSIAASGVRFTNGYVTAAYCSASRAGFLTGKYQSRFGYETNPTGAKNENPDEGLPVKEKTLADMLHDVGYTTGLIGKWHLGGTAKYHPYRRGFDEFFGFMHEGRYFVPPPYKNVTTMLRRKKLPGNAEGRWTSRDGRMVYTTHMGYDEPDYDADNPIYRGGQPVDEQEYLTDAFTRESVDFIGRNADRPFFLYVAYNAVHSPLQGADRYMKRFEHIKDVHRRIFAAMLGNLDDSIGAVLKAVHDNELQRDTIVFFLSDNGGPTRELTSSNLPLRDGKGSMYEGGIRIPFMVKWPGQIPAGKTDHRPVISLDIFGTAAAVSGAQLPAKRKVDGVDLMPYLTGNTKTGNTDRPHQTLFWRTGKKTAVRHGDWKLLRNPGSGQDASWQLYDLANDLSETRDLRESEPGKFDQLLKVWTKLNSEMAPQK